MMKKRIQSGVMGYGQSSAERQGRVSKSKENRGLREDINPGGPKEGWKGSRINAKRIIGSVYRWHPTVSLLSHFSPYSYMAQRTHGQNP